MRLAFVLWSGKLGGAETLAAFLAAELRSKDVDAGVVFVQDGDALSDQLDALSVPWTALNLPKGRAIFRKPRRYAKTVRTLGPDCAILMSGRFLASALRLGGYKGRIIAVEHGDMFLDAERSSLNSRLRTWDRAISARAIDVEIGVSEFTLSQMRRRPHADDIRCIYNGVATDRFRPSSPLRADGILRVGYAGRLIPGKGLEHLLEAVRVLCDTGHAVHLEIAGDGVLRVELGEVTDRLGISNRVTFSGWADDMPAFWNSCDLAVSASDFTETFGMAPVEAAACGRPSVVTRNGGFVEVVDHLRTGVIVPPGDPRSLATAIARYDTDRQLLQRHGAAARARAEREFSIERCASAYLATAHSVEGPALHTPR